MTIIDRVIKDLEKLEQDRIEKVGCSQTKLNHTTKKWIQEAYHRTLETAIALRMYLDKYED